MRQLMKPIVLTLVGLAAPASAAASPWGVPALQTEPTEEVTARVTSVVDGSGIVIDRGRGDGVAVGDRVTFSARGGAVEYGTILELEGRNAIVRPEDPAYRPAAGTRASIQIPASRFDEPAKKDPVKVPVPTESAPADGESAPAMTPDELASRWTRDADEWTTDMPLLAGVTAVRPENRASSITGRSYMSWDRIVDSEPGRGDSFFRTGGAVFGNNLFGHGGQLHFDAEFNMRRAQLPGEADEDESNLRLDRISYTLGGNRHHPNRLQFGRFLQSGMPEFGVLDGASWSRRRESGDSYGGSAGFLPEPDKDQESLEDFQLAAWYRWVADEREQFSLTGGYQKTWHNGTRDRDLVIAKFDYIPSDGWTAFGNAWIDLYGVGDDFRSGPGLTYAILDLRRDYKSGLGLDVEYRHQEYPELLRAEFPPGDPRRILDRNSFYDAHVDRLSVTGWRWNHADARAEDRKRLWVRAAAWADEEEVGGDGEVGVDVHDLFGPTGRGTVSVFASHAKFTSHLGARVRYGRYGVRHSWSALYEVRQNDITGFNDNNDDALQHRARGNYELFRASGLSASLSAEYQVQDFSNQVFLGLFLQHSF